MSNINQVCIKCNKTFLIVDQEQKFVADKGLPLPTWCHSCRQQRRLLLRGERQLFKTKCQKCGQDTITSFDPKTTQNMILCKNDYDQYFLEHDPIIKEPLPAI